MEDKIAPKLLGEKIKMLRKSANYTQETFCEKIGIEPQNLSRIERGLNYPSLATFIKISEVLEIKPNDLLDTEYLNDDEYLEDRIYNMVKQRTPYDKKLIFRIIKAFSA